MYTLSMFSFQIVLSLAVSAALLVLLRPVLYDILLGACGTTQRAAFWLRFVQINLVIAPLLLVIMFAPVTEATLPGPAELVRDTLLRALSGAFGGVLVMGQVIWKTVKAPGPITPRLTASTTTPTV